jgi:rod shape-determining protein MreD
VNVSVSDVAKVAALLFVVSILQSAVFSGADVLGGTPDLVLVTLLAVALLRGSVYGAVGGFFAGLLVDTALDVQTIGLTSLLLTVSGYWIGRYGETTGRDRAHAPFLSVAIVTFLYALASLLVHFVLGDPAPAGNVLRAAFPSILLNLVLTAPVFWLCRRLVRPPEWSDRAQEVRLLG